MTINISQLREQLPTAELPYIFTPREEILVASGYNLR